MLLLLLLLLLLLTQCVGRWNLPATMVNPCSVALSNGVVPSNFALLGSGLGVVLQQHVCNVYVTVFKR